MHYITHILCSGFLTYLQYPGIILIRFSITGTETKHYLSC